MRKDQEFPVSIEVQFLGGDGKDERTTGNLCTPGTNVVMDGKLHHAALHQFEVEDLSRRRWVTAEIEVHGDGSDHGTFINGKTVIEYDEPQLDERDADAQDDCSTRAAEVAHRAARSRCSPRAIRSSSARSSCCRSTPSVAVRRARRFMARQNPARPTRTADLKVGNTYDPHTRPYNRPRP